MSVLRQPVKHYSEYDLKHAWVLARNLLRVPPKPRLPPAPSGIAESARPSATSVVPARKAALIPRDSVNLAFDLPGS